MKIGTTLQDVTGTCELFYSAPTGSGVAGVGDGESRNAYRGMYWTGESITTCGGSIRLSPVGDISGINYEVAVWSVDPADNLSLDTKLESVIISGANIVEGWNSFTFSNPVTMTSGNTVIVISRTDPATLDGTNYIRVYNGYDESDTESRQWNVHYEPTGAMAGRFPGDEDQPEYFTCDWRLNSYEITSALARPNIPEDVVVTRVSAGSINIDWVERGVNDVVIDHYNIYQYNLSTAALTLVGTSTTTEYTHTGLAEGTYTYVVTAVSTSGLESYHSLDNGDLWDAYVEGGVLYDQPTLAVSNTNTGTSPTGIISGTYTLADGLTGICTWSHSGGSVAGFATVLLGSVSGTVTGLPIGTTPVSFNLHDSEGQEVIVIANFTRNAIGSYPIYNYISRGSIHK